MASDTQVHQELTHFLAGKDSPVIDAREKSEFSAGHISGSANFPAAELIARLHELPRKSVPIRLVVNESERDKLLQQLELKGIQLDAVLSWKAAFSQPLNDLSRFALGDSNARFWQPAAIVESFVADYGKFEEPKTALDIGCGSGRDAVYLAMNNWQVTAVDYLPGALEKMGALAERHSVSVAGHLIDLEATQDPLGIFQSQFDLVLVVRYLHRPLLSKIKSLISPGGFIVYQTFMEGCERFGKPKNPRFLLKAGELAKVFAGFEILQDKIEYLDDGRPTNVFIARKSH